MIVLIVQLLEQRFAQVHSSRLALHYKWVIPPTFSPNQPRLSAIRCRLSHDGQRTCAQVCKGVWLGAGSCMTMFQCTQHLGGMLGPHDHVPVPKVSSKAAWRALPKSL